MLYLLLGARKEIAKSADTAESHGVQTATPRTRYHTANLVAYTAIGTASQIFIGSVIAFIPLFIVDQPGESAGLGAALPPIVFLGGLPAGPLASYFADRVGPRRMLIVAGLVTGPVIYILGRVTGVWFSVPVLLALGALMFVLMPISETYIINQTTERNRSTVLGIYYACSRGGSGFLNLEIGYLVKRLGFAPAFTIGGIVLLVIVTGCVIFLWYQMRKGAVVQT